MRHAKEQRVLKIFPVPNPAPSCENTSSSSLSALSSTDRRTANLQNTPKHLTPRNGLSTSGSVDPSVGAVGRFTQPGRHEKLSRTQTSIAHQKTHAVIRMPDGVNFPRCFPRSSPVWVASSCFLRKILSSYRLPPSPSE